jgi:hypothetical protein
LRRLVAQVLFGLIPAIAAQAQVSGVGEVPPVPRVIFRADQLTQLTERGELLPKRSFGADLPYWTPSDNQVSLCEKSLRVRAGESDFSESDLKGYIFQYYGVTVRASPTIYAEASCPRIWVRHRDKVEERPLQVFHYGRCQFHAYCDPASGAITQFSINPSTR